MATTHVEDTMRLTSIYPLPDRIRKLASGKGVIKHYLWINRKHPLYRR